ncbi:MAG TPA: hypothetical protein VG897_05695 [Terriglobales bacterium]|nr:hypothetical protein [Terriglobales bacterium]
MASMATDTVPVARTTRTDNGTERAATRNRRSRTSSDEENSGAGRYFLAKANSNGGPPALDREVASEGEALVEALRLGVTYYAVQEFRVIPDFAGRRPQLTKEAVRRP